MVYIFKHQPAADAFASVVNAERLAAVAVASAGLPARRALVLNTEREMLEKVKRCQELHVSRADPGTLARLLGEIKDYFKSRLEEAR